MMTSDHPSSEPTTDGGENGDAVSMWDALDVMNVPDENKPDVMEHMTAGMSSEWEEKAHENVNKWGLQSPDALLLAMGEEMGELAGEVHGAADYPDADGEDARMAEQGRDLIRRMDQLGRDIRDYLETVSEQDGQPVPPEDRPDYLTVFPEDLTDSRRERLIRAELDDLMALGFQFQWSLENGTDRSGHERPKTPRVTVDDDSETVWVGTPRVQEELELPEEPESVAIRGRNIGFRYSDPDSPDHDSTTVWVDAAGVRDALELPGEPLGVRYRGENIGFQYPLGTIEVENGE